MNVQLLKGLPAFGPMHLNFSLRGLGEFCEGVVVRFELEDGSSWVGNFQEYRDGGPRDVVHYDDWAFALVVAAYQVYWVDIRAKKVARQWSSFSRTIIRIDDRRACLLADDLELVLVGKNGLEWETGRMSWDGIYDLQVVGGVVRGKAYNAMCYDGTTGLEDEEQYVPFEVDLDTGAVKGGIDPSAFESKPPVKRAEPRPISRPWWKMW